MTRKRKNSYYNKMIKIHEEYTDLSVKCKCGHSVFIPQYKAKEICSWCYRTVYNTNEIGKKAKFIDELKKSSRKVEKNENN